MKKLFLYSLMVALFSLVLAGCGGGNGNDGNTTVDPNAPIEKLDPTVLKIEFD